MQIETDTDWQNVYVGYEHAQAIKTNGTLWAWGSNFGGALGDGTNINKYIPTQIGTDTNWLHVYTGNNDSHAFKTDNTLWAWGRNDFGQLGDGTLVDKYSPIQIGTDTNWQTLTSGGLNFSMAINTNGSLWGWGNNSYGQLGNGNSSNQISVPNPIVIACPTSALGVESFSKMGFKVFPNPVKEILTIQNPSNLILDNIVIRDVLGKTVIEQKGNNSQINVSALNQGLYILQIQYEGHLFSTKIIKL